MTFFYILSRDEAAKQWSQFEQQWTRENESREHLLEQLLHQRQEEIANRLEMIEKQTEETEEKQRILIADMEQARKYQLIQKEKYAREIEGSKSRTHSSFEFQRHPIVEDSPTIEIDRSEQKSTIPKATVEPKVKLNESFD